MLWKMKKEDVTGYSDQDIIQIKNMNGSFMDFLLKRNVKKYELCRVTGNIKFQLFKRGFAS